MKLRVRSVAITMATILGLGLAVAIAGTEIVDEDVAVVGDASAEPGLQIAQGSSSSDIDVSVTADDGNLPIAQAAQGFVTLVTKYVIDAAGNFEADDSSTATLSFNVQNFSLNPQTLTFENILVEVDPEAPCDEYRTEVVFAEVGNQIAFASGFSAPLIFVQVIDCDAELLFSGLLEPYDPDKVYKAGSTVPLKWQYTDGDGNVVDSSDLEPTVTITPLPGGCESDPEDDAVTIPDDEIGPGGSGLTYDESTDTWHRNFKTPKGANCYKVVITADGAETGGPFFIETR